MLRGSPPCRGREAWRVFRDRIPRARPKETACAGKSEKRREGRVRRDGASGGRDAALGSRGDARGASVRARRAGRGRACGCGDVAAGGRRHRGVRVLTQGTRQSGDPSVRPNPRTTSPRAKRVGSRIDPIGLSTQKEIPTLGRVEPRTTVQRDRAGRARSGKIGSSNEQRSNAGRVKILPNTSWAECTTSCYFLNLPRARSSLQLWTRHSDPTTPQSFAHPQLHEQDQDGPARRVRNLLSRMVRLLVRAPVRRVQPHEVGHAAKRRSFLVRAG